MLTRVPVVSLRLAQVAALWPGDPYKAHWLMTADGHIAGMDTTPERLILERWAPSTAKQADALQP
jgi:hypothetical protein